MHKILSTSVLAAILPFLSMTSVDAATRTWVSGVGDDVNPCSRTAPCKTFAGAISKTDAKGEINVLDPGAFGAVTITKSISIISQLPAGALVTLGSNDITINASTTDVVELHGLDITGVGTGNIGIRIIQAGSVHIRKSVVRGFSTATSSAISIAPTAGSVHVYVFDCLLTQNKQGVLVAPTGAATATVMLDRVVIESTAGTAVRAQNNATVRVTNSVITNNNRSFLAAGTGQIISFGNNVIVNNSTNDPPTSTVPLQ